MKRPSHDLLMQATDALSKARDVEREAGNPGAAMVFNDLVVGIFKAALDTDFDMAANAVLAERHPEGGAA